MKPDNYHPKITASKQKQVEEIKQALLKYKVICIFDLAALPSKQLQFIRHKLRNKAELVVKKKRFIKLAIKEMKQQKDLSHILRYIEKGNPSLMLTNEDPFSLYKLIKASKSMAAAKPGQIAPKDLIVEAGPTNFPPGPIIGELGQAGIIAAVEQGKVVIKKETIVAKKGDVITQKKADVLSKLGIQPMEIGMKILAALDGNIIYTQDILEVDEQTYLDNLKEAFAQAHHLTIIIGYITPENIKPLLRKAFNQAKYLAEQCHILTSETIKNELKKAEFAAITLKEKLPEVVIQDVQDAQESPQPPIQPLPQPSPQEPLQAASQDALETTEPEAIKPKESSHVYSEQDELAASNLLEALKERDIKEKARKAPSQVYSKADEEAAKSVLEKLKR